MKNLEWTTEMPTKENIGQRFLLVAEGIFEQTVYISYGWPKANPDLYVEFDWWHYGEVRCSNKTLTDLKNARWFGPIPECPIIPAKQD